MGIEVDKLLRENCFGLNSLAENVFYPMIDSILNYPIRRYKHWIQQKLLFSIVKLTNLFKLFEYIIFNEIISKVFFYLTFHCSLILRTPENKSFRIDSVKTLSRFPVIHNVCKYQCNGELGNI